MKEKKILAMFITAAITLVASLSITFGVLTTLADPVVATGVTRYTFAIGAANNALITKNNNVLKMKDSIVFQPSSSLMWSEEENEKAIWFNDEGAADKNGYLCDIMFADESISTKLKVIPLRISNKLNQNVLATVKVTFDNSTLLGRYTFVQIYDFKTQTFTATTSLTTQIDKDGYADYAVVIYADDSLNTSRSSINFGTDYEEINVEVTTNAD